MKSWCQTKFRKRENILDHNICLYTCVLYIHVLGKLILQYIYIDICIYIRIYIYINNITNIYILYVSLITSHNTVLKNLESSLNHPLICHMFYSYLKCLDLTSTKTTSKGRGFDGSGSEASACVRHDCWSDSSPVKIISKKNLNYSNHLKDRTISWIVWIVIKYHKIMWRLAKIRWNSSHHHQKWSLCPEKPRQIHGFVWKRIGMFG